MDSTSRVFGGWWNWSLSWLWSWLHESIPVLKPKNCTPRKTNKFLPYNVINKLLNNLKIYVHKKNLYNNVHCSSICSNQKLEINVHQRKMPDKLWYMHRLEYSLTIKRNQRLIHMTGWISDALYWVFREQTQQFISYIASFLWCSSKEKKCIVKNIRIVVVFRSEVNREGAQKKLSSVLKILLCLDRYMGHLCLRICQSSWNLTIRICAFYCM